METENQQLKKQIEDYQERLETLEQANEELEDELEELRHSEGVPHSGR